MGYHYKESGHGCWDILLTTKKGQEEGHLPKGVVSKYGIYRCRSCHGDFYLYSRNASDKKRRGVLV